MNDSQKQGLIVEDPAYPNRLLYRNIYWPAPFEPEKIDFALAFRPDDSDVIFTGYPKTGQTWTQNIVFMLLNDAKSIAEKDINLQQVSPWLTPRGPGSLEGIGRPRTIKLHLKYNQATFNNKAKYIVNMRNPKDTFVSLYHMSQSLKAYEFKEGSLQNCFEIWLRGEHIYNDYFDHGLSWLEAMEKENVLILPYEQMKENPEYFIQKIAKFVGGRAEACAEDSEKLAKILKATSFEAMQKDQNRWIKSSNFHTEKSNFFMRKGQAGDWKNHLNKQQSDAIDAEFEKKFSGTPFEEWWKDIMEF